MIVFLQYLVYHPTTQRGLGSSHYESRHIKTPPRWSDVNGREEPPQNTGKYLVYPLFISFLSSGFTPLFLSYSLRPRNVSLVRKTKSPGGRMWWNVLSESRPHNHSQEVSLSGLFYLPTYLSPYLSITYLPLSLSCRVPTSPFPSRNRN